MLRTERLILRPLVERDVPSLHEAYADEETMRWWHLPVSASLTESASRVRDLQSQAAQFAICLDGDSPAVGHVGWITARPGTRGGFGYLLRKDYWGEGIATEAGRAALEHGLRDLGAAGAELWVYEGNARSAALAERLRCTFRTRFVAFNLARKQAFDTRVYGVTAADLGIRPDERERPRLLDVVPSIEVGDLGRALRFWTDELGFEVEFTSGDPPALLSLTRRDWGAAGATVRFRSETTPRPVPPLAGALDVPVAEVDDLYAEFKTRGVRIDEPIETKPWGLREFSLIDPNGVRVRFYAPAME